MRRGKEEKEEEEEEEGKRGREKRRGEEKRVKERSVTWEICDARHATRAYHCAR
jgi:hypothetical protein